MSFLRIFTSISVAFEQQTDCAEDARHLQVRLGGGFRGPGPRANVGLEKAVSQEAAFFCLRFTSPLPYPLTAKPRINRGRDFFRRVFLNEMAASDGHFGLIREIAAKLSLFSRQDCSGLGVDE